MRRAPALAAERPAPTAERLGDGFTAGEGEAAGATTSELAEERPGRPRARAARGARAPSPRAGRGAAGADRGAAQRRSLSRRRGRPQER